MKTKIIALLVFGLVLSLTKPKTKYIKRYKVIPGSYTFIPSNKFVLDGDSISLPSYYMYQTEVTNINWLEYITWLENNEPDRVNAALPDSSVWMKSDTSSLGNKETTNNKDYYFRHPAYSNYPVVGISKAQAGLFAVWVADRVLELANLKGKVVKSVKCNLPTYSQWYNAASNLSKGQYSFGKYLRNHEGRFQCNFKHVGDEHIGGNDLNESYVVNPAISEFKRDITASVYSYWPNYYGLYNMNGNVAEMVSDSNVVCGGSWNDFGYDVRNQSTKPYTGPSSTVGFRLVLSIELEEGFMLKP
jgi:formylglycine-generating enzyme required for sulfatase activity